MKVKDENCNDITLLLKSVSGYIRCGLSLTPVKSIKGGSVNGFTNNNVIKGFANSGVTN